MKHIGILTALLAFGLYLGIYNGNVALIDSENHAPVQVFPYRADLFPDADQKALEKGIPISSKKDLLRLFEDYFS